MTKIKHSHYFKPVPAGATHIDVYRVLSMFGVTDPCLQHAAKKVLVAGGRGAGKDIRKDIEEAIDTLQRKLEMMDEDNTDVVTAVTPPYVGPDRRAADEQKTANAVSIKACEKLALAEAAGRPYISWYGSQNAQKSDGVILNFLDGKVDVVRRDGVAITRISRDLNWVHTGSDFDIIAYREHVAAPAHISESEGLCGQSHGG